MCEPLKPLTKYGKNTLNADGIQTICKPCAAVASQTRRLHRKLGVPKKIRLQLYVVGPSRKGWESQMKLFGSMPRSDVSLRTSEYCTVHSLPDDVRAR